MMTERRKWLYSEIAAHTWALCLKVCPKKDSETLCCCEEACNNVAVDLEAKGIPVPARVGDVRFLKPNGCILPAWQRPYCSMSHCWFQPPVSPPPGFREEHQEWMKKYSKLMDEIWKEKPDFSCSWEKMLPGPDV